MLVRPSFRHLARVEMHLPGNTTRVVLPELAHGDIRIDIPTDSIPLHLRALGSRLIIIMPRFTPEPSDTIEAIRAMRDRVRVEEADASIAPPNRESVL